MDSPKHLHSEKKVARILLGPQTRTLPTAGEEGTSSPVLESAMSRVAKEGTVALVTAGWQEREAEDSRLREALGGRGVNLELFRRSEEVFDQDHELFLAFRERRRRLHELQRLHRLRLDPLLAALRQLQAENPRNNDPDGELLSGERESALEVVRSLDQHHLEVVERVRSQFEREWLVSGRSALDRQREEILALLDGSETLVVAGGHVEVLLESLRLFDLREPLSERNLVVWSAGAMALSSVVLLFHDHPPWGAGNAEVLDRGLDLLPVVLPLPHARWRLRLEDRDRVLALARRVAPLVPVVLGEDSLLDFREDGWWVSGTARLEIDGSLRAFGEEAEKMVAI